MSTATSECKSQNPNKPGHSLVIAYHVDTNNNYTFFFGQESSYIEYTNPSGKTTGYRRFDTSYSTDEDYYKKAKEDPVYLKRKQVLKVVLRKDKKKGDFKYTIQEPKNIWGFPKGGGDSITESSRSIALREFEEEVGYRLKKDKLVFKRCIRISGDVPTSVFHYKVTDEEKNDILDAYKKKTDAHEGEFFSGKFYSYSAVQAQRKNKVSEKAIQFFAQDLGTSVDQFLRPIITPVSRTRKTQSAKNKRLSRTLSKTQKLKRPGSA